VIRGGQGDQEYRASLSMRFARATLFTMQRTMPGPLYNQVYQTAFTLYRFLIRVLYLRFWIWYAISGNKKERCRTETIFRVMPYSLVGWRGLKATSLVMDHIGEGKVEGAIVECGVARGGSAALMAMAAEEMDHCPAVWLFDSFEGLPNPTRDDFVEGHGETGRHVRPLSRGSCLGTYEEVGELLFRRLRLDRKRVRLVKGWFQETLPATRENIGPIALLRVDGDWYESTRCCLENLYDQMVVGGYIIVDDYGACYGAKKAIDEFVSRRGIKVDMTFDGRGGCYFSNP